MGGAIVRYIMGPKATGFPGWGLLSDALRKLNETLELLEANHLARRIITYNNMGCFEEAWSVVSRALLRRE